MPGRPLIEVCVSSVADAVAAVDAGADRLELCCALEVGGLTPSVALLESVLAQMSVPVVAMIRPRPGGFFYQPDEFRTALSDAKWALRLGASGVVFGFLTAEGGIDTARCREMIAIAGDRDTVFHRAFDYVRDPLAAADQLVDLGVTRLLTSGQRSSSLEGADLIRRVADRTRGKLQVMPGGGIRPENVLEILEKTGCDQVHVGAAIAQHDHSLDGNPELALVATQYLTGNAYRSSDSNMIEHLARAISSPENSKRDPAHLANLPSRRPT